jgi:hypothetical protein
VEDELLTEILTMVGSCGPSIYAPSLRDVVDEDVNMRETTDRITITYIGEYLDSDTSTNAIGKQDSNPLSVFPTLP